MTQPRHTYGYGYKTREEAEDRLEDFLASGEISLAEDPRIESYHATVLGKGKNKATRYRITLPFHG